MGKSDSTRTWLKQAGGEPVTWKGLLQTGLVVGSLSVGVGGCIHSNDAAHEVRQDAEIKSKADKQDLVDAVQSLERWIQRFLASVGEQPDGQRVVGQIQGQEQSVFITDWMAEAVKEDFAARRKKQIQNDFGPCVIEETYDARVFGTSRSSGPDGAAVPDGG